MKLANLFLITALVSVLAAIGCSEDSQPANGNGGSGGTGGGGGTDPCTGDFCDDSSAPNKEACEEVIALCNTDPELDFTTAECQAFGKKLCPLDPSGTGGTGGGGGTGGTPSGGNCDYGDCENEPNKSTCETLVGICMDAPMPDDLREFCIEGTNLDQCGDPQL